MTLCSKQYPGSNDYAMFIMRFGEHMIMDEPVDLKHENVLAWLLRYAH